MSVSWFHCDRVRLADGWASHVEIALDDTGVIQEIRPEHDGGERFGGAMMPGMPNLHSHAFQRAMAGAAGTGCR